MTQIPDPNCAACGGTGLVPPFMDDCTCEVIVADRPPMDTDLAEALDAVTPEWLPPLTSPPVVLTKGGIVDGTHRHAAVHTPHKSGDEMFDELMDQANAWDAAQDGQDQFALEAAAAADVDAVDGEGIDLIDGEIANWEVWPDPDADDDADLPPAVEDEVIDESDFEAVTTTATVAAATVVKGTSGATLAQHALITKLIAERDPTDYTVAEAAGRLVSGMTPHSASKIIDALLKVSVDPTKKAARPNKYDGVCRTCQGEVPANTGRIEKVDGRWVTYHLDGGCLTAEAKAAMFADRITEPGLYKHSPDFGVDIYRVRKSRSSDRLYAEKVVVHEHDGEKEVEFVYNAKAMAFLRRSTKLTWAEARAFGAAYGSCVACGRTLSDARSLVQGYGNTCSAHYGWPTVSKKQAEAIIEGVLTWEEVFGLTV